MFRFILHYSSFDLLYSLRSTKFHSINKLYTEAEFQLPLKMFPNSSVSSISGLAPERTSRATETCIKFPRRDNCLTVTKWDNSQNRSATKGLLSTYTSAAGCCPTHACIHRSLTMYGNLGRRQFEQTTVWADDSSSKRHMKTKRIGWIIILRFLDFRNTLNKQNTKIYHDLEFYL